MQDHPIDRPPRPSWSDGVVAALLATLERPAAWVLALAGFLARGGIVLFLLAIVTLPTPARLQVEVSPLLVPLVFGQVSPGLVTVAMVIAGMAVAWLLLGGLVGAWTDAILARSLVSVEATSTAAVPARVVFSAFLVRLLAHLPLAIALTFGAVRIVTVAYAELLTPFEVTTPLAIRILSGAPEAITAIGLTWWLGEAAGGLAVREVVLAGRGPAAAVVFGWLGLVRRPLGAVRTLLLVTLVVFLAIGPALIASRAAWDRLRVALADRSDGAEVILSLVMLVALWCGGLVLAAVSTAFRSAAWTAEWGRGPSARARSAVGDPLAVGTIGDVNAARPGGWPSSRPSGTL